MPLLLKKSPLKRFKRRLMGCCLIIVLAFILACGALAYLMVHLASAQTDNAQNVLLLIDNSNSMFEKGGIGSDPDLLRIEAARLFISYLGVDSSGQTHRVGVIFFGGEAHLVVPLTPLTDDIRRSKLMALIESPSRQAWTNPATALELAEATFSTAAPGSGSQALVLLTDGKPEWSNTPSVQERTEVITRLRAIAQRFANRNIPLFIILLQNQATDADPEIEQIYVPLWQEMAAMTSPGKFFRARRNEDLLDIYHDIVVTLTGRQSAGIVIDTEVQQEQVRFIQVEPDLAQMTLVIRKSDPEIQVRIILPDGRMLNPRIAGVQRSSRPRDSKEEIWAVTAPEPGTWQVKLSGQGSVTVWKDFYPAPSTPTFTPTFTPTPTSPPSPTLPATSTATPTLSASPTVASTPTATPSATPSPVPVALIPSQDEPDTSPPSAAAPPSFFSAWCVVIPFLGLLVLGGGWWLHRYHNRPRLSGILRKISAPPTAGLAVPSRLDLADFRKNRFQIGPDRKADLCLPSTSEHITPMVSLTVRLAPDGSEYVTLTKEQQHPVNGMVLVNNLPLNKERRLYDGDVISLGAYRLKYENLQQRQSRRRYFRKRLD
ncbi:MAG: VWA domain-containing protein [Chloroflexi bacterium]|nr:MAG: VWA domain-containing protein [Chloroflexota bacterium]